MSQVRSPDRSRAERVCVAHGQNGPATPPGVLGAGRAAVQAVRRAAVVQANEAAMLMSTVAMAPLRLVGGGYDTARRSSPTVKSLTGPTTRPVLLVHGFAGTTSSLALVAHALNARGMTVEAMSYPPLGTSVKQLAERLVAEVERILLATGADKVHLVGHSLGGVVIAQAIADRRLDGRVDTVITLGSPFGGSPWAGVLPFVEIVRALRAGSPLLRRLASAPLPDGVAVAVIDSRTRHHCARAAFDAIARPGGNHHLRWCRPSRNARESAGNRLHSRRLVHTTRRR